MAFTSKRLTTRPETGMPTAIPIAPPIIAKAMYFAAKSHLNLNESTPSAYIIPISFSSFLRSAIIVNLMVINMIAMRNALIIATNTEIIACIIT